MHDQEVIRSLRARRGAETPHGRAMVVGGVVVARARVGVEEKLPAPAKVATTRSRALNINRRSPCCVIDARNQATTFGTVQVL